MKNTYVLFLLVLTLVLSAWSDPYTVGDTVADFSLKNVDGNMIRLSDYSSEKGVILIFDCNTCPYSKLYNKRIMALSKRYRSAGFPVITVNANDPKMSPGDSFDKMVAQARSKGYDFPYLIDETQEIAKSYGATNTPQAFVLKRNGSDFVVAYIGAIDNNPRSEKDADKKYVEDAVDELLQGREVTTPKTKAIGCGIKYRKS
jgi:peroxiredoxin